MNSPNQMLPIKTKQSVIKFSRLFAEFNSGRINFSSHSVYMDVPSRGIIIQLGNRRSTCNEKLGVFSSTFKCKCP